MTVLLLFLGLVTGVGAAARSTYSPCGLSMLSTITPFGERARRHRYPVTAAWFVAGAALGGATLGGVAAGLAAALSAGGLAHHPGAVAAAAAALAAGAAAVDAGLFGEVLPLIRRQVDDGWLARYRPWVYGAGFGWQIGVGLATYLMTAGVILVAALAALTASPATAVVVCTGFGVARGLTVFLTAGAGTPARLKHLHGFLDASGPTVRWAQIGLQAGAAVDLALTATGATGPALWPAAALAAGAAVAGGCLGTLLVRPGCSPSEHARAVGGSAVGA